MEEGFIKLYKKFQNWQWYKDKNTKSLFLHFLINANWKEKEYKDYIIPRGSLVSGRYKLSEELDMTPQEVRTAISHLKSTNEITTITTNKFTIYNVVNYEKYQDISYLTNQQSNQQNVKQSTTIEEYKNINNNNSLNNIYEFAEEKFGRTLNSVEYDLITQWIDTYEQEKIELAIKETLLNNVKNLKYTNSILINWADKPIEEIETKEKKDEPVELFDYDWLNENKEEE